MSFLKLCTVLFLLVAESTRQSCGGGVLKIEVVHFENHNSQLSNGSCCDGTNSITGLCDLCDYYFRFCFSFSRKNDCKLLNVTTHVLTTSEFYLFPTSFRSRQSNRAIKNPMVSEVDNWVGALSLVVNVFDEDSANAAKDDYVSLMKQNVTLVAKHFGNVQSKQPVVLLGEPRASGVVPKLTLVLSIQCDDFYLIPNCSEYCIDDASGHYTCNYTKGSRDCHHGWYGSKCDAHCIPRNDTSGHFSCEQNGMKSCLPGWIDASTNCTRENSTKSMSMTTALSAAIPKKRTSALSYTTPPLQPSSMLEITASYIEHLPSRSSARIRDSSFDCPTVADDHTKFTQYPNSNTRTFVLSSVWVTSHTGLQFDEDSHPSFSVLRGTSKLEPIGSYIGLTESSIRNDVAKTSDVNFFFRSLDSTLSNREFLLTMGGQDFSAESTTDTLQHKDGANSSWTDVQLVKLTVHDKTLAYTANSYLATVPDSKLSCCTSKTTEKSTMLSKASLFTVATHNIRMSTEATVHPSPFTLPKHQITLSTAPSLQPATVGPIKLHSTIPSLATIHGSTILEQNQTQKQFMADRRRFGGVWQRNKYFILATFGFFALVIMLAIVVARIKRKNRVQSLKQSTPDCHDETDVRNTIIDGDNIDSQNPYILVHHPSSTNLGISNYRSCASFRGSESPTQTDAGSCSRSSSFLTGKPPNDAMVDDCVVGGCQSQVKKWPTIKCWTPVENQGRTERNGPFALHKMKDEHPTIDRPMTKRNSCSQMGCRAPRELSLTMERSSAKRHPSAKGGCSLPSEHTMPRELLTPEECSTPLSHHSPIFIQKRNPFLRRIADDAQHGRSSSKVSVRTETFEMDRVQNFSKDRHTDCTFVHCTSQSARIRSSTQFQAESISQRAMKIDQRKSTASEGLMGSQLFLDKAPRGYPSILLTEASTCCSISTDLNLPSSSIYGNIYDNISLSSADIDSRSCTSIREDQIKSQSLLPPSWEMAVQRSSIDPKQLQKGDRPKSMKSFLQNATFYPSK